MNRTPLLIGMAFIIFGFSIIAIAKEKTITIQTATIGNGRKVILKSDGTWEYEGSLNAKIESTLSLDTGIVFRSGDVKPVARTTFYLLDDSLVSILNGSTGQTGEILTAPRSIYVDYCFSIEGAGLFDNATERYKKIVALLKPHVLQSVTTDFSGKATFTQMSPGKYYLFGYSKMGSPVVGEGSIIWDVETNLSAGSNTLTLDQNNAAFIGTD